VEDRRAFTRPTAHRQQAVQTFLQSLPWTTPLRTFVDLFVMFENRLISMSRSSAFPTGECWVGWRTFPRPPSLGESVAERSGEVSKSAQFTVVAHSPLEIVESEGDNLSG
jgi:hypothetical protein